MLTSHAMVNPGGTGIPRFVISARFAPLPPSTRFMSRVPSARPAPKKYTDFLVPSFVVVTAGALTATPEPELVGVSRWRRRVVTGEAGMAEPVRAVRHRLQHAFEREI